MLTMADLIAVLSLCLTSFGLGYTIGCNNKTTTKDSLDLWLHISILTLICVCVKYMLYEKDKAT